MPADVAVGTCAETGSMLGVVAGVPGGGGA